MIEPCIIKSMKIMFVLLFFSLVIGCTLYQSEGRKAIEDGSISLEKISEFSTLEALAEDCATTERLNFLLPYTRIAGIFTDQGLYEVYNRKINKEQKVVVTYETNESISYCQYIFDFNFNTVDHWNDFVEDAKLTLK